MPGPRCVRLNLYDDVLDVARWCVRIGLIVFCLLGLGAGRGMAAEPVARPLEVQPWSELAYGVSFRPPLGMRSIPHVRELMCHLMDADDRFDLRLGIQRPPKTRTLQEMAESARKQVALNLPAAAIDAERSRRRQAAGRPVEVIYYRLNAPRIRIEGRAPIDGILAQAIIPVMPDGSLYLLMELHGDLPDVAWLIPTFEAVLDNLAIVDQATLTADREKLVARGMAWRKQISTEDWHAALIPEQSFRVVDAQKKDIGYVVMRQQRIAHENKAGFEVAIISRVLTGPFATDTISTYFVTDDGSYERWEARRTQRPQTETPLAAGTLPKGMVLEKISTSETGVRVPTQGGAGAHISVWLDGPDGPSEKRFEVPSAGYLAQAERLLLPQLLPRICPPNTAFMLTARK